MEGIRPHSWLMLRAALVCALAPAIFSARPAAAGAPDPHNCTVDHVIIASMNAQGAPAGVAPCSGSATPGFDVWVRDSAGQPVAGCTVSVQFTGTGTAIHPYQQQNPGVSVDCTTRTLSIVTDANGHAVMVPRFGHYAETAVVPVYADGFFLQYVEARSPDYDQDGTVSLADFNQFYADYASLLPAPRSDFDDCPNTTLGDFQFFVQQYFASTGQPNQQRCP